MGTLESRLERAVAVFNCLTATVGAIVGAPGFASLIELFDKFYRQYSLTVTKKLDFMTWRYGATLTRIKPDVYPGPCNRKAVL